MAITVLPAISVSRLAWIARLDLAVERGGGLVEHQDRRVLQDHAGDGDRWRWPPDSLTPRSPTWAS
jgi:hypothetical protein